MILLSWFTACSREPEDPIREALDWVECGDGLLCSTLVTDGADVAVAWFPPDVPAVGLSILASGGPGSSSLSLLYGVMGAFREEDPDLWATRNWVALDNRGIGLSGAVDCVDETWFDAVRVLDPVPADDAAAATHRALRDTFVAGCLADRGEDGLAELGTPTHVADLDRLRATLGQDPVDFVGFSYGTWTGAAYAAAYPEHGDRFVLDGVVAPLTTRDEMLWDQAEGFELALERFFDRCAADPSCPVAADPAGVWDRLLAAAAVAPLPAPSDADGRTLGRNDLRWAAASLLYNPDDEILAEGLAEADGGDATLLLEGADEGWGRDPETGDYDPTLQGYWAVGCLDLPWPAGWTDEDVWAFGASLDTAFPRLGSSLLTGELNCSGWPVTAPSIDVAAPEAPPLLLVGGRYDPATPWEGAVRMQEALGNDSSVVTFEGDGHVAMFGDTSGCTYDGIRGFLLAGAVPADCP